jgi:adenylate cyclase
MNWTRLRNLFLIAALSTAIAQLATEFGQITGIESFELNTLDLRQRTASEQLKITRGSTEVVLVFFDEEAVDDWPYLSPFPRRHLATLVNGIAAAGAKTIGLDVFLADRYEELNEWDGGDDLLREAIENAGNVVLVADLQIVDGQPVLIEPDPFFADVAADVAAADLPTPFETIRDGTLAVRSRGGMEPSFALSLWAQSRGVNLEPVLEEAAVSGRFDLAPFSGTMDAIQDNGPTVSFPLRFIGPPSHLISEDFEVGTFQAMSSSTVEQMAIFPSALEAFFRDKIVLLGTGFHESDQFRTPYYGAAIRDVVGPDVELPDEDALFDWMYGVEIHANAIQDMIDGKMLRPLSATGSWVLLFVTALLAGGIVFLTSPTWGAVASVAGTGALYFSQLVMYTEGLGSIAPYLWVPIVPTVSALWLSYLGSTAFVAIIEGKEKRYIRSAFGKYVSPAVVKDIASNPDALKLGGQKRSISVFFSDLAGFTTMSERMTPEDLIAHLNEYLTEMTEVVMSEEGTLDKYIGDAIMAFWNAPIDLEDHADRAMRCAVMTQRKMNELNARWRENDPDAEELVVRIGINTGDVVVGNVGGENRFDYSAIGDAVNLGARLEPANKDYDTLTMVSQFTVDACTREAFRLRELDFIAVKGKVEPVPVYELIEMAGAELAPHKEETLTHYDAGMVAYKHMDWELASTYFEAALAADATDGPSKVYLERSRENIADPPPADWDFVVRRTVK